MLNIRLYLMLDVISDHIDKDKSYFILRGINAGYSTLLARLGRLAGYHLIISLCLDLS